MHRRDLLAGAAAAGAAAGLGACRHSVPPASAAGSPGDAAFARLRDAYFAKTMELYPVVCTYVGGDGWRPSLAPVSSRLRDWSSGAISAEIAWLKGVQREVDGAVPSTRALAIPANVIDRSVISGQVAFLLHMLQDLRWQERSVETYTQEIFRSIDFLLQQQPQTEEDWRHVVDRVAAVPAYLAVARENLRAGKANGNLPDRRMVAFDGVEAITASARYFSSELPALAIGSLGARPFAGRTLAALRTAGDAASRACTTFAEFLSATFDHDEKTDRFAIGEKEYRWRLGLLHIGQDPQALFEGSAQRVAEYQDRIFAAAGEVARFAKLSGLSFRSRADSRAAVRAVQHHLDADHPKDTEELFRWYRETIDRSVEYARTHGLFDVPKEYRLEILPMPPSLGEGGASYYPAPAFKAAAGLGRFYLGAPKDAAGLARSARSDVADTAVHEGFPGHDWNYQVMNRYAGEITNVRWLTPGEVEGCFSMWEDSMATEGWALYAEALMATPMPGRPHGFYTPGEYMTELGGQLYRSARVHVDVGIHTGRMTFDEAVDYFLSEVSFLDGARAAAAAGDAEMKRRLARSGRGIYRYSKWPTQAITYELGKLEIERLRDRAKAALGPRFDPKTFHEQYMRMGSIPPALFEEELMRRLGASRA